MARRPFQLLARLARPAAARRVLCGLAAALLLSAPALAQPKAPDAPDLAARPQYSDAPADVPPQAQGVDVEERVGQTLPMELVFTNDKGQKVRLGDYFKGDKPAIMALVYYKCPVTCTVVMQRLAETINSLDFTVGKEYNALIFSFDPTETTKDAAQQKLAFVSGYSKEVTPEVEAGWVFHTTPDEESARQLADALGFKFRKLDTGRYSHPVALFIITPQGKISRYLYGFSYPTRDVKLALMEASKGKLVRTVGERLISYCFLYDPNTGKYSLAIYRVMQIAGMVTAGVLGSLIAALFVTDKIRRNRAARAAAAAPHDPDPPQGGSAT